MWWDKSLDGGREKCHPSPNQCFWDRQSAGCQALYLCEAEIALQQCGETIDWMVGGEKRQQPPNHFCRWQLVCRASGISFVRSADRLSDPSILIFLCLPLCLYHICVVARVFDTLETWRLKTPISRTLWEWYIQNIAQQICACTKRSRFSKIPDRSGQHFQNPALQYPYTGPLSYF